MRCIKEVDSYSYIGNVNVFNQVGALDLIIKVAAAILYSHTHTPTKIILHIYIDLYSNCFIHLFPSDFQSNPFSNAPKKGMAVKL